jgi:membrane protease YdiL (CAAX protease family)
VPASTGVWSEGRRPLPAAGSVRCVGAAEGNESPEEGSREPDLPEPNDPGPTGANSSLTGNAAADGPSGGSLAGNPDGSGSSSNGSSSNGNGHNGGHNGAARNGASSSPWAAPEWSPWSPDAASGAAAQAPGAAIVQPGAPAGTGPYPEGPYPSGPYQPGPYASGPQAPGAYPMYPPNAYPPAPDPHPSGPLPDGRRSPRHPAGRALGGGPIRTHRWGLGAYVLVEAVFLLTSVLIGWAVLGDMPVVAGLILALAVPTVLAAGTAVLITVLRGNGPRTDLRLQWSWSDVGLGVAFGFGGLALTVPASLVYVAIVGPDAGSAVGDVFGSVRTGPLLAAVVLVIVVFLAPLCEEIVYRGLLWGGIERLANRWVAFGVTTLLFAMAHFEFTRTPLLLVVAIPIAVARLYTGRLLPSIVAHQVNNLLPGVVLMLGLLGLMPTG